MSYLDNLSPPNNEEQDNKQKKNNAPWKTNSSSNNIPCGRGPMGSYLDAVTNKANTPTAEETNPISKQKIKSWSNKYLSNFNKPPSLNPIDNKNNERNNAKDDSRTDIRNLLTQRSIQSFMYLLEQCRDPHSAKFLQEDFLQTGNLLDYHGTGAEFIENFGGTWYSALLSLIQHPKHSMIISAKRRGRGHGGWSQNNPYLKERWVEIPIQINPPNLCERILIVREQIAKEWIMDLDVLMEANDNILDSYFDKIQDGNVVFERTAVNLLNDKSRFDTQASSPFRRTNFDLVYNLCTQASIHRILRNYMNDSSSDIKFNFLKTFYIERTQEYFDGEVAFGAADDFIEELLESTPTIGGTSVIVDPLWMAHEIIKMRNVVALEWKGLMREVEGEHFRVRRAVLSKQFDEGFDWFEDGEGFQ